MLGIKTDISDEIHVGEVLLVGIRTYLLWNSVELDLRSQIDK